MKKQDKIFIKTLKSIFGQKEKKEPEKDVVWPVKVAIIGDRGRIGKSLMKISKGRKDIEIVTDPNINLDVTVKEHIQRMVNRFNPDVIINAASYNYVEKAERLKNKKPIFNVNSLGAKNVAEVCKENGIDLIHISTHMVFAGKYRIKRPLGPNCPEDPKTVYGESKLEGERDVTEIMPNATIVRTTWVHSGDSKNFVTAIAKNLSKNNKISVLDDSIGSLTHADHVAEILLRIATYYKLDMGIKGIWHFSDSGKFTWRTAAEYIAKQIGASTDLIKNESIEGESIWPEWNVLDTRKTVRKFGKSPSWKEGIDKTLKEMNLLKKEK